MKYSSDVLISFPDIRSSDLRDRLRGQALAKHIGPQEVQQVVPGQPFQHALKDTHSVEMAHLFAQAKNDLVELVRIDVVIPDDMFHEAAYLLSLDCIHA